MTSARDRRGRARDRASAPGPLLGGTTRLQLFGEVLVVGAAVAVLSLPLVTAVPAVAAGVLHLRRHLSGEPDSLRDLLAGVGPAVRDLWPVGLALPVVLLGLGYSVWISGTGALPGGTVVGVVSALVALVAVVVALRTAGTWAPGRGAAGSVRAASRRAGDDLGGSGLLVAALAVSAVLVWMLLPLLLVVGGLLAMAVLAVEHRWAVDGGGHR
ncbi:hypothetical protein [uncultured Cellulomonas sp.]|uniref:hypothetical protein n=1 Tax=uncultured Cellulomonas sp. TaxID=189682 RepID=UPI002621A781|nr:hypothetical protein [uncultured Cellulomonas sp.]